MTPDQLSAIRERLDAATPGPWEAGTASCCPDLGWVEGPKGAVCPQFTATKVTHSLDANDAELIAHAPTDLRALLAEVEALRAERDDLLAWSQRFSDLVGVDGSTEAGRDDAFAKLYDAVKASGKLVKE
jgi:hypothetical protein